MRDLFLYEDAQKGYFALCCYKGRLSRRRINTTRKLFTVVENFELHLCDLASADSEAGYQTAMSPNERKVPQRGRTDEASSIKEDQGAKDNTPLVQRRCTRASCCTYISTFLKRERERERSNARKAE